MVRASTKGEIKAIFQMSKAQQEVGETRLEEGVKGRVGHGLLVPPQSGVVIVSCSLWRAGAHVHKSISRLAKYYKQSLQLLLQTVHQAFKFIIIKRCIIW